MQRFWDKVDTEGDCWIWQAGKTRRGYGLFKFAGRMVLAHRIAYELMVDEIPSGLEIDHLCRNTSCVNPDHLEAVTHYENIRRGKLHNANKTHCPQGHRYSKKNTRISNGKRYCKACQNSWRQRREAK